MPDGDLFRAIAAGKAVVVTDEIERFTFGALGGYALGNRMRTRILIYDANPRQVTNSRPDKPQALTRPRTIDPHRRFDESGLFPTRRSNISSVDPHDPVSYLSLSISHEDYLHIAIFQELRF